MAKITLGSDPLLTTDDTLQAPAYQPLFNEKQIKARTRIVDTTGEQWDIGESSALQLNFDLIDTVNPELIDQVKYLIAQFVRSKSPDHTIGTFNVIKDFLNQCENFDEESGLELAEALADEMLYYFASNRKLHDETCLSRLRHWYRLGAKLRLPMFQKSVGDALKRLKLTGNLKGLDVLVSIEGKSPLNANQLCDLRRLLQHYADCFYVGETNFWRVAVTWVFITLGIRPVQLQLLMIGDLAVNVDKATGRKTYLLNVPSAKKRNEAPRTRFKSRPIPVFLGELLVLLKTFNVNWLDNNGYDVDVSVSPLFMPTSGHHKRKAGARHAAFINCYSKDSIVKAPDLLLKYLNTLQKKAGDETVDLKINPRRLRKTFATHAASCGTPAMVLMELLDHEDMQHVMIYYKLGANFAIKIDRVYREDFGTMLDFFKGKISLQELSYANKNKQVFGPEGLRRLVGIGLCGKDARCRLTPPYSCYTCVKFEACNDKQIHEEVLGVMVEDVEQLFDNNVAPGKYEMDHINACRSLIARLEVNQ